MQKNDIKKQFPIFQHKIHGKDLIYFDNASTAQVPQSVLDAMNRYYTTYKSNVGRGIYQIAEQATLLYAKARESVASFIGAKKELIIFTSGATESLNLVAQAWVANHLKIGDEIVISQVEHHSNFVPWQQLAVQKKLKLVIVPVNAQGTVDPEEFQKYLNPKTKFVSIVHTSNVTGGTNDVVTLTKMAHDVGAKVLIDAAQSVVHQKIDVVKIGCDFLLFSGHKLFGPTGVGVLYATEPMMKTMQLQKFGGGMVFSVAQEASEFKSYPDCFEAGTPNIAGVIGLAAAIDFVQKNIDFKVVSAHETILVQKMAAGLSAFEDIEIISFVPSKNDGHSVSMLTFYSKKHHAHDIAAHLDNFGIAVRAGHHCAQPFHEKRGINASVRVSFAVYNTQAEVEYFLECLKKMYKD
ncbi:cysteine desulfurase [Candidatus Babeliales bacterium]|nr:cysteine desulfurase [Candidatus Babeliales bacterium]